VPFEEKMTWVSGIVAVVVPAVYFIVMLGRLQDTPAADIAYQWPLVIAIVASVVLSIVGAIVAAIGTGISAELRGRKAEDEIDRKDERDKSIARRGDLIGFYVSSVGIVGALILAMTEADYFWIASAIYLSFAVGSVVGAVVKLLAYHRGF
jgi:MFS family permease